MSWKKILCPIDLSANSRDAMHHAADLAGALGAELTLLHVYELPVYALPDGAIVTGAQTIVDLEASVARSLAEWRDQAQQRLGRPVATRQALGAAAPLIVAEARTGGHDLIVMGTHGRSGLDHLLLGSVAEKVMRRASCPVLTVRPRP
jgi:nucleotide-binding universal stress UspA family protein